MSKKNKLKITIGLSGGVDSAVSAHLLKQQGHHVEALFMKNWDEEDTEEYCHAAEDLADAQAVCEQLDIPLHSINFSAEYWDRVFEHFLNEYRAGRTPNPDILCNQEIKFKAFLDYALDQGADCIATGHYARIKRQEGKYRLLKGIDDGKDQTYFLYTLGQHPLSKTLFPIGGLHKTQVREIAHDINLPVKDKKDSTGICFIGERKFKDFLSRYLPAQPGDIRDSNNQLMGQHQGLMYHTIGQRQGLGIGGQQGSSGQPWYVIGKEQENNILRVAQGHDHPELFTRHLTASQLRWSCGNPPAAPCRLQAKIRHRQADQACTIVSLHRDSCKVEFTQAQRAITAGQSIVFYDGDECLGGGVINATR
ncbi:MAG: tRNA 2-thiouridine(34) synthase MnmA [Gammaproteobacteria bacterium]|nr:tRNA 2-thiouridine(34) synthase MnmA [Gammaproteobacteria bacterium]